MRVRIGAELARLESEHRVRILLAVESGSRAWGFPSVDSDYDVRFIYIGSLGDYLSVSARRDVIEQSIVDSLDVNGWDVRKALQAALRSNAVLLEWLTSPVRYRDEPSLTRSLSDIARLAARLPDLEYHYDRLARRNASEIGQSETPRLKAYCYAVRPTLALRWLRQHRTPPPMDLPSLMQGVTLPAPVTTAIRELVGRKAHANEARSTSRIAVLDTYVEETLSREVSKPVRTPPAPDAAERAQTFFTSLLL